MKIDDLKEIAYRAYSNTSFTPEKRAAQILKELKEELTEDLKALGENAGNYEAKYIGYARSWLEKKSRCLSAMITGPSNFPVKKNRKANDAEAKGWENFRRWREKYFKAVNRVSNLSPEDDMEAAIKKVDALIIRQQIMKSVNKIVRNKKLTDDQKIEAITEYGLSEETARKTIEPDFAGRIGFPSYALTNNNAKIKAAKEKILIMKNRIATKESFEPIKFDGGSIEIENDRVCIYHDEKPERETIESIKAKGFHWSKNYGSWSRKHTARALQDAKELVL